MKVTTRPIGKLDWDALQVRIRDNSIVSNCGCWEWTGAIDRHGYARISVCNKNWKASRASWCAFNRQAFPGQLWALHNCDNRKCVNPDHIRPGTARQNMLDAWRRGGLKRRFKDRTHCKHGHKFTEENSAHYPSIGGHRRCRECDRLSAARSYQKRG